MLIETLGSDEEHIFWIRVLPHRGVGEGGHGFLFLMGSFAREYWWPGE